MSKLRKLLQNSTQVFSKLYKLYVLNKCVNNSTYIIIHPMCNWSGSLNDLIFIQRSNSQCHLEPNTT